MILHNIYKKTLITLLMVSFMTACRNHYRYSDKSTVYSTVNKHYSKKYNEKIAVNYNFVFNKTGTKVTSLHLYGSTKKVYGINFDVMEIKQEEQTNYFVIKVKWKFYDEMMSEEFKISKKKIRNATR